ncbi:ABC transporter B family member 20-like [Solanum tuberosum]|uniref:p-glycoprotein n=1 Tax=Solanum tuberosum TaxID=4113 RepID=M1B0M8_SOLTU|nr:PREDICTED: ABC transporter B family member 20-like [Solanum tuberosum]
MVEYSSNSGSLVPLLGPLLAESHGHHLPIKGLHVSPKNGIKFVRCLRPDDSASPLKTLDFNVTPPGAAQSSSIEYESSRVIQEALDTIIMGNKTTILIAHRAAMMRHVDNIVVLNGGRIVEEGTHDTLMSKNGLYVRLTQPHFGKGLRQHRLV